MSSTHAAARNRPLVSIGLPVRNGAATVESVIRSVLAQDYEPLEIVISDNASTDGTEELCRGLASKDSRVIYYRHPSNVGLLNNFIHAARLAKGVFFRWIGDDDWLAPSYVSKCMEAFANDERLLLVTTQLQYVTPDGSTFSLEYDDKTLQSGDWLVRWEKLASHLASGYLPIDPLYALTRRSALLAIARRNMIREDEVFAAKLAFAGPWGHVPETLAKRNLTNHRLSVIARYLDVPLWQAYVPTTLQCWEMLRFLRMVDMTPSQRSRAVIAVGRVFLGRHRGTVVRGIRKLARLANLYGR